MRHPCLEDFDLPLNDLMTRWPETLSVFARHKMLCIGCMVGPFHTVADACAEYGLEEGAFCAELAESITRAS